MTFLAAILAEHLVIEWTLGVALAVVLLIAGVWGLLRQARRSFVESVEAIVCKHISPVREDLDALKVEVKADHVELRELVVANAEALQELNGKDG